MSAVFTLPELCCLGELASCSQLPPFLIRYFTIPARHSTEHEHQVVGKVWFGPGAQGHQGYVHGGAMFAVLDEALAVAAMVGAGRVSVTGQLKITCRRMLPLL